MKKKINISVDIEYDNQYCKGCHFITPDMTEGLECELFQENLATKNLCTVIYRCQQCLDATNETF
jgi:hypothetical protein